MSVTRSVLGESRWRWAFWPVPLIFLVIGLVLPSYTFALDRLANIRVDDELALDFVPGGVEASRAVASTVATAMLSFIGVVFSISVVAVQMAASQLSPRILRIFVRQRLTKWTLGIFLATFAFALSVLGGLDDGGAGGDRHAFLPIFSILAIWIWVTASVVFFIAYVSRLLRLMQPVVLIDLAGTETWWVLTHTRHPDTSIEPAVLDRRTRRFVIRSWRTGVLTEVNVPWLIRLARRRGWVLRVGPRVGDYLTADSPLVEGYHTQDVEPVDSADASGEADPTGRSERAERAERAGRSERSGRGRRGGRAVAPRRLDMLLIRWAFRFGDQRSVAGDPAYGIRLLVDIAVRALSPGINDPTTAVQALDRVIELLRLAGHVPDPTGVYTDRHGRARVVRESTAWTQLVELAFTEVRRYGAGSPQVTRRMLAGLEDLAETLPEGRQSALAEQRELLVAAVAAETTSSNERRIALRPDRQGLG